MAPVRRSEAMMTGASGEAVRVGARLGWLYLEQGHLADAEAVFEAVLRSDPADDSARDGLETVAKRRETADSETDPDGAGRSPRKRKIAALERYLARIRRGAAANP